MDKVLYLLLIIYIFALPLIPTNIVNVKGKSIFDICLLAIFLVYFIKIIICKKSRENFIDGIKDFFRNIISIAMFVMAAWMVVSVLWASDKSMAINESFRFVTYIALFFIIKYEIKGKNQVNGLLFSYIGSSLIVCLIGIVQFFAGTAVKNRITSTMDNSNNLAGFLILVIFPAIMVAIYEKEKNRKIFWSIISCIFLIALIMTSSRNAIIGMSVGIIVLALFFNKKFLLLFGGLGSLALLIPQIWSRVKGIFDYSQNESRIKLWKIAAKMIKDHPYLGVGNGNYISLYGEYIKKYPELEYSEHKISASHNSYLKVQSELGVVGETVFLTLLIGILYRVFKIVRSFKEGLYKHFYMGFIASICAFYVMNIVDNLFFVPKTTTYFWVLLAVVEGLNYNKGNIIEKINE